MKGSGENIQPLFAATCEKGDNMETATKKPQQNGIPDFHPFAAIFPLLEGDTLQALAEDIQENGLREPIWLYEGRILDGRNRAHACKRVGIPLETREFRGSQADALAFVWSENAHRRHLFSSQAAVAEGKRALLCAEYAAEVEKLRKEAAARKAEGGKRAGRGRPQKVPQQITEAISPTNRETSVRRARAAGTNRRYLEVAERLLETNPELLEAENRGRRPRKGERK
jgi:hypothetical protein